MRDFSNRSSPCLMDILRTDFGQFTDLELISFTYRSFSGESNGSSIRTSRLSRNRAPEGALADSGVCCRLLTHLMRMPLELCVGLLTVITGHLGIVGRCFACLACSGVHSGPTKARMGFRRVAAGRQFHISHTLAAARTGPGALRGRSPRTREAACGRPPKCQERRERSEERVTSAPC